MQFFPSQMQKHKGQSSKYFVIALACFMLPLLLEALHIVGLESFKSNARSPWML